MIIESQANFLQSANIFSINMTNESYIFIWVSINRIFSLSKQPFLGQLTKRYNWQKRFYKHDLVTMPKKKS